MIKAITVQYDMKDWEKLNAIREKRDITWEDLIFLAVMNLRVKK